MINPYVNGDTPWDLWCQSMFTGLIEILIYWLLSRLFSVDFWHFVIIMLVLDKNILEMNIRKDRCND